jgi:hypothetical protein
MTPRPMFRHSSEFVTFRASPHFPGVELYSARLVDHAFVSHVHDGYSTGAMKRFPLTRLSAMTLC